MYRAHRQDRVRFRELLDLAHQTPGDWTNLIQAAREALVEEAIAWENLWTIREDRWEELESFRNSFLKKNRPVPEDKILLLHYHNSPQGEELDLQELAAERCYRQAQKDLRKACRELAQALGQAAPHDRAVG